MVTSNADAAVLARENELEHKTIMLVDDDPVFRRFISVLLNKEGYIVVEAEHGLDGLQQLRNHVPDLIVCDISMPILDGIEFAEEVSWEYPDIPMIVVSATDDMSDVARALRFGIKDFLTKPITKPTYLTSAINNTLQEEEQHNHNATTRDFSSQWFRVGEEGDIPEDNELHWHLNYLKENPNAANELLTALLPERDTKQGDWQCSYNLLQSLESLPLVFDYAWLIDGQFAFYLVDSTSDDDCGVGSALLVRALFNDCLRNLEFSTTRLREFSEHVERGIKCIECASPVRAMFGIADMTDGTTTIIPAGLEAVWSEGERNSHIKPGDILGEGGAKNSMVENLSFINGAKLTIANIGVSHFSLEIRPTNK